MGLGGEVELGGVVGEVVVGEVAEHVGRQSGDGDVDGHGALGHIILHAGERVLCGLPHEPLLHALATMSLGALQHNPE